MSYLYVCEQGAQIGLKENRIVISYLDGLVKSIPIESLESIEVFGNVQLTTQCIGECLRRGIVTTYYSTKGAYYGRLASTSGINVFRQRQQAKLGNNQSFSLEFSKKIIYAKIKNQEILLKRYNRGGSNDTNNEGTQLKILRKKIQDCKSVEQVMGYEGTAAKEYFKGINKIIETSFRFSGRSRRPPKDPFNSMISLGYSILMNEIYGKLEAKGLNPYFGFMHKDRENHPTLASDLMEEWRAVLIDSTVLSLINGHEIRQEHFYSSEDKPGVFLDKAGMKIFLTKLEKKFRTETKYLNYVEYATSFRRAINLQVGQLVKAIEMEELMEYQPIQLR